MTPADHPLTGRAGDPSGRTDPPPARGRLAQAGDAVRQPVHVGGSLQGPVRTCVGCRIRAHQSVLLRVVASENGGVWSAVPDPRRRLGGRGAWVHPDGAACLDLAERRRAFPRALRLSGPLDTAALREYVAVGNTSRPPEPSKPEAGQKLMSTR